MSGHSKWKQIKHKKETADQRRGEVFAKLLNAIAAEARRGGNPNANPRLRSLMEDAKRQNIPKDKIENAISKTTATDNLEELTIEAYGPGGTAMLIKAATDNRNRTISEIKHTLSNYGLKIGEFNSVRWIFDDDRPKFTQTLNTEEKQKLNKLINDLNNHPDVRKIITNAR